jgi:hypothetical protein
MQTLSSANLTCIASLSAVEWIATGFNIKLFTRPLILLRRHRLYLQLVFLKTLESSIQ